MKKSIWDKILKVVIAVASAILGALGANAMNVTFFGVSSFSSLSIQRRIHRLADRLEAGSGGIGLAACHVAQEFDVIELMETQGVVHTAHLGFRL